MSAMVSAMRARTPTGGNPGRPPIVAAADPGGFRACGSAATAGRDPIRYGRNVPVVAVYGRIAYNSGASETPEVEDAVMMMRRVEPMMFFGCTLALAALAAGCGEPDDSGFVEPPVDTAPAVPGGFRACSDGVAGDFPCSGMDLMSKLTLLEIGLTEGSVNDVWGWTDPETGTEWALVGHSQGTSFVSLEDPERPVHAGLLPLTGGAAPSIWRDIKVYGNHAFIVADGAGAHGMQVFDLTRLRGLAGPQTFSTDAHYVDFENSHNLAIDEATGFAYAVATDTCGGGLHIIDIRTPNNPMFAGCHDTVQTHDTQCVVYGGPDAAHRGRQICISSNLDHLEVVDVTEKSAPLTLSSSTYPQFAYVHQGWLTEDHRFFLLGDELDEIDLNLSTRTHVFDVSDLDAPVYLYAHDLGTRATDHNLYVRGDLVFEANYTTGLRVLRFGDLANRELEEIVYFDTAPQGDEPGTDGGAWSVYPYLPSGTILVSDIQQGLFALTMP